jgi:hypothetical protein
VAGTYLQLGVVPRWFATLFGVLLTFAILFAVLWFASKPRVSSAATPSPETGETLAPSPTPDPTEAPPEEEEEPSQEPSEEPSEEEEEPAPPPEQDGGGGGGGGDGNAPPAPESPVPARNVQLHNTYSDLCADIPERGPGAIGNQVQQSTCTVAGDNMLWHLDVQYPEGGPDGAPLFQIVNEADGLCMDLGGYGGQPLSTPVIEGTCDRSLTDNQLWWLEELGENRYWIHNFASNDLCLEPDGLSSDIDVRLTIYTCIPGDDQEWRLLEPLEN